MITESLSKRAAVGPGARDPLMRKPASEMDDEQTWTMDRQERERKRVRAQKAPHERERVWGEGGESGGGHEAQSKRKRANEMASYRSSSRPEGHSKHAKGADRATILIRGREGLLRWRWSPRLKESGGWGFAK
jgi:hypothetical protein